jgi:hypothetical protein
MPGSVRSYCQDLGEGLVMAEAAGMADVERLAAFNAAVHGVSEGREGHMSRVLMLEHPATRLDQWLYVEDQRAGRILSSLCLFPWTWQYDGVTLRAGEMGFVGTLEAYRHRGLVRALCGRFEAMLQEGGYDLSPIQGIPYFYRQFGYEYAMPLEAQWQIDLGRIPDGPTGRVSVRLATIDDRPALAQMYDEAASDLNIHTVRDEATWGYLFGSSQQTDMAAESWLLTDLDGQPAGYFRITREGFGTGLIVSEVSRLGHAAALTTLVHLKRLATERGKPNIRFNLPAGCSLVRLAADCGARDEGGYAWQIRLPDCAALLKKMAPLFERRLACSAFAGLSQSLTLNLYREAFGLCFRAGRLTEVQRLGFREGGDLRLPPALMAPLLLGYRSWRELAAAHHDVLVARAARSLADTLFPVVSSFIYTIY